MANDRIDPQDRVAYREGYKHAEAVEDRRAECLDLAVRLTEHTPRDIGVTVANSAQAVIAAADIFLEWLTRDEGGE